MKHINKVLSGVVALAFLISCADESLLEYAVNKPGSIAQLEYLNDYDVLKNYVDRSSSPDFKLGAGVTLSEFNEQGLVYSHIVSNFDEITAGYGMKHGAVVQDDGSIDTSGVKAFVAVAEGAGVTVYGHTLCWHANQNAIFLNSTIAPIVLGAEGDGSTLIEGGDFEDGTVGNWTGWGGTSTRGISAQGEGYGDVGYAYTFTNTTEGNSWDCQVAYDFDALENGETYVLDFKVKASAAGTIRAEIQSTADYSSDGFDTFGVTTEWKQYTLETVVTADDRNRFNFSFGDYVGTIYIDDISLYKKGESSGPTWDVQEANDFESDDADNYQVLSNDQTSSFFTADGEGANGTGRALAITNSAAGPESWSSQLFFKFSNTPAEEGDQYELSMDIRSDAPATIGTQAQTGPGAYLYWALFGSPSFTTEWTNYTQTVTISSDQATSTWIAFNLGDVATTYYFDNISVTKYNEEGQATQIIELTPEEKKDTLTYELERWIAAMMKVTKHYVKAWDVVNEPMDDGNPYELKTSDGDDASDEFYWQDYLGKDYAVTAINLARQYGNADDKLFVNDYNLEYNIDKCKGLIQYVAYIEEQGATVDGIGTQMHISTTSDKDKIVEMFNLLAATGKLIKISELDVGIGDGITTDNATTENLEAQGEMYKYVVEKYLEIIPSSQQYGITAWSPLDSPDNASWRAGQPIGLWNLSYNRKQAYGSFADALSGE